MNFPVRPRDKEAVHALENCKLTSKKQNQNSRQCQFFFYVKGVVMFVFFMKIRMKRCVDAKGEYIKGETK